jgi:hypothetical protein
MEQLDYDRLFCCCCRCRRSGLGPDQLHEEP